MKRLLGTHTLARYEQTASFRTPGDTGWVSEAANVRRRDNWTGESYQLAISYGPLAEVELAGARTEMVAAAGVRTPKHGGGRGGVVRLPTGRRVVCRVYSGWNDPDNAYLTLDIPLEALRWTDRRIEAFILNEDDGHAWRPRLDDWLATVGRQVYEAVPFHSALIGCEVTIHGPHGGPVPETRHVGFLVVRRGELRYLPISVTRR
jgi:hypothetical protein